jgi:hypothetical protein
MLPNNRLYVLSFIVLCITPFSTFSAINDPTKPIFSESSSERVITAPVIKKKKIAFLQSVFYSGKNKTAVINGKITKEGEDADEMLLKAIHKRYVLLEYKKNTIKLYLFKKKYIDKVTGEVSE